MTLDIVGDIEQIAAIYTQETQDLVFPPFFGLV